VDHKGQAFPTASVTSPTWNAKDIVKALGQAGKVKESREGAYRLSQTGLKPVNGVGPGEQKLNTWQLKKKFYEAGRKTGLNFLRREVSLGLAINLKPKGGGDRQKENNQGKKGV